MKIEDKSKISVGSPFIWISKECVLFSRVDKETWILFGIWVSIRLAQEDIEWKSSRLADTDWFEIEIASFTTVFKWIENEFNDDRRRIKGAKALKNLFFSGLCRIVAESL